MSLIRREFPSSSFVLFTSSFYDCSLSSISTSSSISSPYTSPSASASYYCSDDSLISSSLDSSASIWFSFESSSP